MQCCIRLHVSAGCPTAKYGYIPFQENSSNLSHLVTFVRANKINYNFWQERILVQFSVSCTISFMSQSYRHALKTIYFFKMSSGPS